MTTPFVIFLILIFSGGGKDDDDKEEHDAGLHEYDFEFEIPKDLPNSYEQKHVGYIRYSVKIIVNKPWKKDLKLKKMFVINTLIDANDPKYQVAPGDEDQKTLGKEFSRFFIF